MFYELTNEETMVIDGGDFLEGVVAVTSGVVLVSLAIIAAPEVVTVGAGLAIASAIVGGKISISIGIAGMAGASI